MAVSMLVIIGLCLLHVCLAKEIVPKDLLISTVIDPTSFEVSRDALTLLRSIRLFGGRMNEATVLVSIALEPGGSMDEHAGLMAELHSLEVEVDFIEQPLAPRPKTLNKFSTFHKFDATRFAYFLWLDADVLVMEDPLEYLHAHMRPGHIECAPEFYSYMRRYPQLNDTSVVWNQALSQLRTLGEGADVPMGVCNTGVLYFDVMALQRFLAVLPTAAAQVDALNPFVKDRFVDSLYFVAAVNAAEIDVHPFSYSLNYMAFFEKYIVEDTDTTRVVMAHFLHGADFSCKMVPATGALGGAAAAIGVRLGGDGVRPSVAESDEERCTCMFNNEFYLPDFPLLKALKGVENGNNHCHFLAGAVSLQQLRGDGDGDSASGSAGGDGNDAAAVRGEGLVWPVDGAVLHVHAMDEGVPVPVEVTVGTTCAAVLPTAVLAMEADPACGGGGTASSVPVAVPVHATGCRQGNSARELELLFLFPLPPDDHGDDSSGGGGGGGGGRACWPGASAAASVVNATLSLHGVPGGVHLSLLLLEHCHSSTTAYTQNVLVGARPVVLESQALLTRFLNSRRRRGSHIAQTAHAGHTGGAAATDVRFGTGVVACCESASGLATTTALVEGWKGRFMVILVHATPPGYTGSTATLVSEIHAVCAVVDGKSCFVTDMTSAGSRTEGSRTAGRGGLAPFLPPFYPASLDLVYVDYFRGHDAYVDALSAAIEALAPRGMLVGSRYVDVPGTRVRAAVDKFSLVTRRAVLATFAEPGAVPAGWYLEKLHIHQSPPEFQPLAEM